VEGHPAECLDRLAGGHPHERPKEGRREGITLADVFDVQHVHVHVLEDGRFHSEDRIPSDGNLSSPSPLGKPSRGYQGMLGMDEAFLHGRQTSLMADRERHVGASLHHT
jgi:hypothetical protein